MQQQLPATSGAWKLPLFLQFYVIAHQAIPDSYISYGVVTNYTFLR